MVIASLLLALLSGLAWPARAQTFWNTTASAPFGPKVGLVATGDSTLLTIVAAGLLRSTNQGRTWALACRARPLESLYAAPSGLLLAGGAGKVYRSTNQGATWDSVAIATPYLVMAFAETPQGGLLLGTGNFYQGQDAGAGVFYSADGGRSWSARNQGFGPGRMVNHLLADRLGRVFATVVDYNDPAQQPGLYVSANQGLQWQYLPLRITVPGYTNPVTIYEVKGLSISPQDSVQCSFTGIYTTPGYTPILVEGNFAKSLAEAANPGIPWASRQPFNGSSAAWTPLLPIYYTRSGDWYSSRRGYNSGGTRYSTTRGRTWRTERGGLTVSISGYFEQQYFGETTDGKLFMVQQGNEQVYWRQGTVLATTPTRAPAAVQVFPNPTTGLLQVAGEPGQRITLLLLSDLQGRCLRRVAPGPGPVSLDLTGEAAGAYHLLLTLADGRQRRQLVVKQ